MYTSCMQIYMKKIKKKKRSPNVTATLSQQVFHRDTGPQWFESVVQSTWRAPSPLEHHPLWNRCTWTAPSVRPRRTRSGSRSAGRSCRSPRWSSSWSKTTWMSRCDDGKTWMVYFMGNAKWMRTGGTPMFGNHHIREANSKQKQFASLDAFKA